MFLERGRSVTTAQLGFHELPVGRFLIVVAWAACSSIPNRETSIRVIHESAHDLSLPLPLLPKVADVAGPSDDDEQEVRQAASLPVRGLLIADRVLQLSSPRLVVAPTAFSFDGLGQGFSGPQGDFDIPNNPSDATADVGSTAIVETVNDSLAVFDRTGSVLQGPLSFKQLFQGLAGCFGGGYIDPVVRHDSMADRWVVAVSINGGTFCIAVSQTSDPLGAYHRYAIEFGGRPDFPKLAVWPDGYYVTFYQPYEQVCALDRSKMLAGAAMTSQCARIEGFALPSDVDGKRAPAPGTPNFLFNAGLASAGWTFHVDWADAKKSVLRPLPAIRFAPIDRVAPELVAQPGTMQLLQPGPGPSSVTYRFVYRGFADHESLLFTRGVAVFDPAFGPPGGRDAVRWGELRLWHGNPYLYQEGTYAPNDGLHRFYPSAAMDQSGDIAVGFSVGSASLKPGLRFTGRLANDELGIMTQGEGSIVEGTGVQLANNGAPNERWGDYSMMAIDPLDDCTFWYTGQYIAVDGVRSWRTRIGSFKLPGCGAPPPADDFSISVSPEVQRFNAGASATYNVSTSVTAGTPDAIALSIGNLPDGVSASFDPAIVAPGGSSRLRLTATPDAMGSLPTVFSAHGRSKGILRSAPASIQVARNEFALSLTPKAQEIAPGDRIRFLIETTVTSGVPEVISLAAGIGLGQDGFTATIEPPEIKTGEHATYILAASPTLALGTKADVAVYATARSDRHSAFATATTAVVSRNDFDLHVEPSSITVSQGGAAQFRITGALKRGNPEPIGLAVSGLPSGVTAQFSSTTFRPGEPVTLMLQAARDASTGPVQVTITAGTSSTSHRVTVMLEVEAAPPPKAHGCSSGASDVTWYSLLLLAFATRRKRPPSDRLPPVLIHASDSMINHLRTWLLVH